MKRARKPKADRHKKTHAGGVATRHVTPARQTRQRKKAARPAGPILGGPEQAQAAFLDAFAELGTVTHAAAAAGIDRQTHYNWLESDPEGYGKRFEEAKARAIDKLEREATRRAVEGVDEPVFWQGMQVSTVRKYSDTLLIFLLKGAKPEKYRERYEHSGPNGGPIQTAVTFYLPDNGRACREG